MECQACRPKGPGWPSYLDFSNLSPYQKCCLWCNGTKEVTAEVDAAYQRLRRQPGLLSVRATTLRMRALEAKIAWDVVSKKKRPKGHSEVDWAEMLKRTEAAVKTTQEWADEALQELQAVEGESRVES